MKRKRKPRTPSYRHHKATGQGFVELDGHRHYLGRFESADAQERYHRLIQEWLAAGRRMPVKPDEITVVELSARFLEHAGTDYRRPDGTLTSTLYNYKLALRPLNELYGRCNALEFTPLALKAVRADMIGTGWCRGTVNQAVNLIRAVFRWGVAEGLVKAETHAALCALTALRQGRCEARETERVRPVPEAHVDAIREHVASQVWGLVQLQLLTGARPGELVRMRLIDLDTTGKVWTYTPADHKTAHHGHGRTIFIGPAGQGIVREFMARPTDARLFSPREAVAELKARHATKGQRRRTNQSDTLRITGRKVGDHYTVDSYRRAIQRGCSAAGVPVWTPHRLRHNAATRLRREFGIDLAQTILGHRLGSAITEIYAEANRDKARDVIAQVG